MAVQGQGKVNAAYVDIEGEGGKQNNAMEMNATTDNNANAKADDKKKPPNDGLDLQYRVDDVPPWYLCILLGFQHYLTMFGATLSIPIIVAPALCIGNDNVAKSELLGTILFVSGLVTIIQSTIGCRLPIVQGGTFSFLVPTFAILGLDKWQCPPNYPNADQYTTGTTPASWNSTYMPQIGTDEYNEVWRSRMREIQGAIIAASLFQVLIGFSGIIGLMLRFIGPLAIAPTIALIGISLFGAAASFCGTQWWIALTTIFLIALFSQYLRNVKIPCAVATCKGENKGCNRIQYPLFQLFPVILAICISWFICAMLTVSGALTDDPEGWGYRARTDINNEVLSKAKWFRFPYPFQWGLPTFSAGAVFGMLAGVLAGMIESVGDYYACARLSGAPPPPIHAVNRGIFVEGIGCILAGMWGTGSGTTSYSENIGAIGITKVGSRRVIQVGGVIILCFGLLGKFGALFVTIPDPIIGGVFMVMFGMVAAVGISNLQYVDLNSSRNLFIFGFAILFGLALPNWMSQQNPKPINTGSEAFDQILVVLLSTSMFVGGMVGFILDNTIPGTKEERGILKWRQKITKDGEEEEEDANAPSTYDFPFLMGPIRRARWTRFLPLCPTFSVKFISWRRKGRHVEDGPEEGATAEGTYKKSSEDVRQRSGPKD